MHPLAVRLQQPRSAEWVQQRCQRVAVHAYTPHQRLAGAGICAKALPFQKRHQYRRGKRYDQRAHHLQLRKGTQESAANTLPSATQNHPDIFKIGAEVFQKANDLLIAFSNQAQAAPPTTHLASTIYCTPMLQPVILIRSQFANIHAALLTHAPLLLPLRCYDVGSIAC